MPQSERLAINGGPRSVTHRIPTWPNASSEIRAALHALLDSDLWGLYDGPATHRLQQAIAERFDCTHSLLTCSGTMAVELALRGVGVKPDSEVVLAAYDFPGNFRAIEALGAKPVLVDVVEGGWVMDIEQVAEAVGEKTSAVLVSHLHGQLIDIESIRGKIPQQIPVVEDCCQVPGASIDGKPCGSLGDASVLSFGGSKLLSAGRGGAVLSKDEFVIGRARNFGARGNEAFPLSQLQAAVLLPQLEELEQQNAIRQTAAERLAAGIAQVCGSKLSCPETRQPSVWYKLPWMLAEGIERDVVLARLVAEGIPVDVGFRGFAKRTGRRCRKVGELSNALRAAGATLLLHHPALLESGETRDQIVAGFDKVMNSL